MAVVVLALLLCLVHCCFLLALPSALSDREASNEMVWDNKVDR